MTTNGISPKVLYPVLSMVLAAVGAFVQAGDFSPTAVVLAACALGTAVVGYLAGPGDVRPIVPDDLDPAAGDVQVPT